MKREGVLQLALQSDTSPLITRKQFERRRHKRFPISASVLLVESQWRTEVTGLATDLGAGGCCLDTPKPFSRGTQVEVSLRCEARFFRCRALVAYAATRRGAGMGLTFTETAPNEAARLIEWVRELGGEPSAESPEDQNGSAAMPVCPGCERPVIGVPVEQLQEYFLHQCGQCGLQFWHPMQMASRVWYETAAMSRDQGMEPLQVWHKYFLQDARRLTRGMTLFDIGCGTGNLLAAARQLGFRVSGIEMDRNAARRAMGLLRDAQVYGLALCDFARQHREKFDVVTSFEVLEHQSQPKEFLRLAKSCLKPGGYLALSVPNRSRWRRAKEFVDIPPNHLTRWDSLTLTSFLENDGFEILRVREQPVDLAYSTSVISSYLCTGLVEKVAGERHRSLTELAAMDPDEAHRAVLRREFSLRHRLASSLARVKERALWPFAMLALPYARWKGFQGEDLYCLARLKT